MHTAARLMPARVQSGKCRGLAGIVKASRMNAEGQQQGDGMLAHAGDGIEQIAFAFQVRIVVDVRTDFLQQFPDLRVKPVDVRDNAIDS